MELKEKYTLSDIEHELSVYNSAYKNLPSRCRLSLQAPITIPFISRNSLSILFVEEDNIPRLLYIAPTLAPSMDVITQHQTQISRLFFKHIKTKKIPSAILNVVELMYDKQIPEHINISFSYNRIQVKSDIIHTKVQLNLPNTIRVMKNGIHKQTSFKDYIGVLANRINFAVQNLTDSRKLREFEDKLGYGFPSVFGRSALMRLSMAMTRIGSYNSDIPVSIDIVHALDSLQNLLIPKKNININLRGALFRASYTTKHCNMNYHVGPIIVSKEVFCKYIQSIHCEQEFTNRIDEAIIKLL